MNSFEKQLESDYETAKESGEATIISPKILFPTVAKGEVESCLESSGVKFYLDQIAPLTNYYFEIVNFNSYLEKEVDQLPVCCADKTAACMACQKQTTVEKICIKAPKTSGCSNKKTLDQSKTLDQLKVCCTAQTAECLACKANMTI